MSYQLYHSFNGGGWTSVYTGSATSTVVNETATGSYSYEVRACFSAQCSGYVVSGAVACNNSASKRTIALSAVDE